MASVSPELTGAVPSSVPSGAELDDQVYSDRALAMLDDEEDTDAVLARHEQNASAAVAASSTFVSPVKSALPTTQLASAPSLAAISVPQTDLESPVRVAFNAPEPGMPATVAWANAAFLPFVAGQASQASNQTSTTPTGAGGAPRTPTPAAQYPLGQLSPQSTGRSSAAVTAPVAFHTPQRSGPVAAVATPTGSMFRQPFSAPPVPLDVMRLANAVTNGGGMGMPNLNGTSPITLEHVLEQQRRQQLALIQLAELGLLPAEALATALAATTSVENLTNLATPPRASSRTSPHFFDPQAMASNHAAAVELVRGRVYEVAKDQHGCRYLQRLLDNNAAALASPPLTPDSPVPDAAQVILLEIVPHMAELMTDQYANFLVQKLFDMMPHDVRYTVAQVTAPHIISIAMTPHGTFSVQKLIETIATREEMEVIRAALARDVVRLVKDVHGNHVVQKVLQRFDHPDKQFIYDAMCSDCASIATNKQGCCVLQRCLEFASAQQRLQLVGTIVSCALQLVQDPYGNYVLQYVLEGCDSTVNDGLAALFLPHLATLCVNKFSSNVVEKMLRAASQPVRDMYVGALRENTTLPRLLQDDFGNYVIQTALTVASPNIAEGLVAAIKPHWAQIRSAPYAKKLEAKMETVLKKRQHSGGSSQAPLLAHHHQHHQPSLGMPPAVAAPLCYPLLTSPSRAAAPPVADVGVCPTKAAQEPNLPIPHVETTAASPVKAEKQQNAPESPPARGSRHQGGSTGRNPASPQTTPTSHGSHRGRGYHGAGGRGGSHK